ncbi:MAG: glycosyltransferase [Candidatus Magasanikbacteria bacterium]|nr:glycosyltransferase [Candidatus Magasanikbacteria bacterium]
MSEKKKILIISVSAGAGHVHAAKALEQTAKLRYPDGTFVHIDMMDYVSRTMRNSIVETYDVLVRTIPALWGYIYEKTNTDSRVKGISSLIKTVNHLHAKKFYTFLAEFAPDAIICTHSFPAQIIQQSKEKKWRDIPLYLVITDYGIHSFWLLSEQATYFVATNKMKWDFKHRAFVPKDVIQSGIPVSPLFFEKKSLIDLQKKYGVLDKETVVLLLSGGQGFMKSDAVLNRLLRYSFSCPVRIIAIAGKNSRLLTALKKIAEENKNVHVQINVIGWTEDIDEYMRIADVVVTKPGGSTTSECLALGKHMIVMNPIPGQEEHNAEYIAESGYGNIVRTETDLLYYIEEVIEKKPTHEKVGMNAADIILQTVLKK